MFDEAEAAAACRGGIHSISRFARADARDRYIDTAAVRTTDMDGTDRPVLLFDGVCNLCNGLVQWVIERDDGQFRFAPLQSAAGRRLLERHDLPVDDLDTVVLVVDGKCYTKSAAALRVLRRLGPPYSLGYPLVAVPRRLRDRAYDLVAEHRYGAFGRRDACMRPAPERQERFLE